MRIAIFGAGGVGAYFGGRLAEAGEDVVFIARGRHLAAMRGRGLVVKSIEGDMHINPVQTTDDPATVGVVDVVLNAVKTWQVPASAEQMRPMVGPNTLVVPLQNGVEAAEQLAAVLGRDRVVNGLSGLMSYIESPGCVRHVGAFPFVRFGEMDNTRSARVLQLLSAFQRCQSVLAEVPDDIHLAVWNKFLLVSTFSGVGAATRVPLGTILGDPETRDLMRRAMVEVNAVANALGVAQPANVVDHTLAYLDTLNPQGTASMQRDIMDGRPSELEAQTGAIVRLGKRVGVATPVNELLLRVLRPMEKQARTLL